MTTTILQPAPAIGVDSMFNNSAPTTNYGTYDYMSIGHLSTTKNRAIIKFTELSDGSKIPVTDIVDSATLSLYLYAENSGNARTLSTYRVKMAWTEAGVTWNKYDGANNWQSGGCDGANDRESTSIGDVSVSATEPAGWKVITLTVAAIQAIVNGTWTNNGFLMRVNTETADRCSYYSSDYVTDTSLRPKLTVVHHAAGFKQKITVI